MQVKNLEILVTIHFVARCPVEYDNRSMKLRVGLIGLGNAWEHRHRPALRALSDRYEVRAVCEEIPMRRVAGRNFARTRWTAFGHWHSVSTSMRF